MKKYKKMFSIKEVTKILNNKNISDEEALEIRDDFYELAEIAIESYIKEKGNNVVKISE